MQPLLGIIMLKNPYNTGNSGHYFDNIEPPDKSDWPDSSVVEEVIPFDVTCPLCERTQLVLWKNVDWYGEFKPFMYGCAYGLRGGLCTNYREISTTEAREILSGARPPGRID